MLLRNSCITCGFIYVGYKFYLVRHKDSAFSFSSLTLFFFVYCIFLWELFACVIYLMKINFLALQIELHSVGWIGVWFVLRGLLYFYKVVGHFVTRSACDDNLPSPVFPIGLTMDSTV